MLIKTSEARHNARKHELPIRKTRNVSTNPVFIASLGDVLSGRNDLVYWNTFRFRKRWNRPLCGVGNDAYSACRIALGEELPN